ncbi:proline--tRNA ligase [Nocardioides sp. LML1-1-1.1]|uniref:proline--tRNA ligase n=1 Tax=Nocardioides sp. LML1-1-1.1 TaxID=3135248 RepID=UPI0034393B9D
MAQVLTRQAEDFPRWYQDVVAKAELADNGPVRGTMVIRPTGYALWERMVDEVDGRIKETGAQNAYFPLFVPEDYFAREAEHIEGFNPEFATVTHAGGKALPDPVVVRPTSETLFGEFMSKWVNSYRDLPLLLNQWANVVRWEKRPRIFLRTSEFLWQEGHTAHADFDDSREFARKILHTVYRDFMENVLAVPVAVGRKTVRERFAGATSTYTLEGMMRDGKALQMGTVHEFAENFSRAFDIKFSSAAGGQQYCSTTSWGVSSRMVGGMIMCHGDDDGLRVPPRLAPVQVLVVAVNGSEEVMNAAHEVQRAMREAGIRVRLDDRVDTPFGRRAVDAELKGYPIRVEIGPRDLKAGQATVVTRIRGTKEQLALADVASKIPAVLDAEQEALYAEALAGREAKTVDVTTLDDAIEAAGSGWARVPWDVIGVDGEAKANASGITVRCLFREDGSVPDDDDEPGMVAILSRAY